jgi:large subunit ribosomal protein L6
MSRYENMNLPVTTGVTVQLANGGVSTKGTKGELSFHVPAGVKVVQDGTNLKVQSEPNVAVNTSALIGLTFRMIQNMMKGVSDGFTKELELNGVGYKMALKGTTLNMQLGYSHEVNYELPKGVAAALKGNRVTLTGVDKQLVGQVADNIRAFRPVEPYKAKGFKYSDEVVIRKAGKSGAK